MTYLGIDLGTSGLKAILVDEAQESLAEATVPVSTQAPRPGWSEQDPLAWWAALEEALARLRAERPEAMSAVRALGLSGQMHGAVLVDRDAAPIRPAIIWNDGRATRECASLHEAVPDIGTISGIIAMPGLTAPKLLWLKRNEPESFRRIWKVLLPKDYLRLRMTGEATTDMSDAAGTLWLDEAARDWSDAVLAASGIDRDRVPALAEGSAATGMLRPEIACAWGIDGDVVVAGGAGDVAGAAVGVGAVEEGDAFVSVGTSSQVFVTDARYRPQPETMLHAFALALPGRWFRMAAMLNGANCLAMVSRLAGEADIGALLGRVEAAFKGPTRLLFLPYLSGERTPHNDPFARGVYSGLDAATTQEALVQATLEGVAFSFLEARRLMEAAGVRLEKVAVVGGGARSRFFMQLVANVMGLPTVRYRGSEKGPAFGAARLARLALTGEAPADICVKPPVLDVLEPDPALTAAYAERFEAFAGLYKALRPEFRRGVDGA